MQKEIFIQTRGLLASLMGQRAKLVEGTKELTEFDQACELIGFQPWREEIQTVLGFHGRGCVPAVKYPAQVETGGSIPEGAVRLVYWETDTATGAKCIQDILEYRIDYARYHVRRNKQQHLFSPEHLKILGINA